MLYQCVRETLTAEEADRLANACETLTEQLIIWTLLDTSLRISKLCDLTTKDVLWQQCQLRVRGKGGPYGRKARVRLVPMSRRVRALLEHHFALHEEHPVRPRRAQGLVKEVANWAGLTKAVIPHILRHTFIATALQKGISPGYRLVDNKDYPETTTDFASTFQRLKALRCDVFLGAYGGYHGMTLKCEKTRAGSPTNPFIDRQGYRTFVELKEKAFGDTLTAHRAKAPSS